MNCSTLVNVVEEFLAELVSESDTGPKTKSQTQFINLSWSE